MKLEDKIEEPEEEELPPEIIRDSELTQRSKCGYYYFNLNHVGMSHVPTSAYAAMALFFQIQRKKLYDKKSSDNIFINQKMFGDDMLPYELMGEKDLREHLAFKSPKSFGNAMANRWMMAVKYNTYAGKRVNWAFDGQAFHSSKVLADAAAAYYEFVLKNSGPITGFLNPHPFVTDINVDNKDLKMAIRIPELRAKDGRVFIDDPTIWGFNSDFPDYEAKPAFEINSLITLRIMAVDYLIRNKELFRMKTKISEVPDDLSYITYRHFNSSTRTTKETTRTLLDVERVKSGIKNFLEKQQDFTPNHSYCTACPLNTVIESGEIACRQRRSKIKPTIPFYYFRTRRFSITSENMTDASGIVMKGYIQKEDPKEGHGLGKNMIARIEMPLSDGRDELITRPEYHSEIRGYEFELKMLQHMNETLDKLADEKARPVRCEINFERDFAHSHGIEAVRDLLSSLKYEPSSRGAIFTRTYKPFSKV
jgi:hypothetical protein